VVTKIATEKQAGNIVADLVWVAEPSTYEDFKDQDLLLKFSPTEAENLPAEMKDPEGYYYAGRLINMIIGYNTGVSNPPKAWKDLLKPEYRGKLGFPSPIRSGAADASVQTLVAAFGWEYFESFKANGGVQVKNNSTCRDMLSTGELQVGVLLDYMVRSAKAKGSPIEYVWPEEGAIFIPSPVAIFKTSKNPDTAKVFVDYVLSKEGQATLVELGSFIPVRPDVDPPQGAPALDKIGKMSTNWVDVKTKRQESKDKWASLFAK
jgi:iron(III) transport system substrate-binding protein